MKLQAGLRARFASAPTIGELLRHTTVRAQVALLANVAPVEVASAPVARASEPAAGVANGRRTRVARAASGSGAPSPEPRLRLSSEPELVSPAGPCRNRVRADGASAKIRWRSAASAPRSEPEPVIGGRQIIAVSAASPTALAEARQRLADHLTSTTGINLAGVAATLDRGRERFPHRFAVVADDPATAAAALRAGVLSTGPIAAGVVDRTRPVRLVFAFGPTPGPAAQAFAAQRALVSEFTAHGAVPDVVTGAGAGHLTAAVAAGVLSFADGARLAEALDLGTLASALEEITFAPPAVPIATAEGILPAGRPLDTRLWAKHLTYPADPAALLSAATGNRAAVVAGFGGGFLAAASTRPELTGVSTTDVQAALAQLWCSGVDVQLADRRAQRVRIPGYPFARPGAVARRGPHGSRSPRRSLGSGDGSATEGCVPRGEAPRTPPPPPAGARRRPGRRDTRVHSGPRRAAH